MNTKNKKQIKINIADLLEVLEYCNLSNGKKDWQEHLNGVHFETRDGKSYAVATDGMRMLEIELKAIDPDINVTLQPIGKAKFPKAFYDGTAVLETVHGGLWTDQHGNTYKEIDRSFPDWKRAIPRDDTPTASKFCLWSGKNMDLLRGALYAHAGAIVQQNDELSPAMIKADNKVYVFMPMRR